MDLAYHDAGLTFTVIATPAFLKMNPTGKVPNLIDGDGPVIFEANSVLRYTAMQCAVGPFWPEVPAARAVVDKWAEWAKINFTSDFISDVFLANSCIPLSQFDYAAITLALGLIEKDLVIADKVLTNHTYLTGEDFSLADIQLGHYTYR